MFASQLETLSERDMERAAEAVVDAAIHCYESRTQRRVPGLTRTFLVDAVRKNPSLTSELFRSGPEIKADAA